MNGSQVLAENSCQEGNSSLPNKVIRYNAEERKERIEKYRSKRNQRNFQKKITVIYLSISLHFFFPYIVAPVFPFIDNQTHAHVTFRESFFDKVEEIEGANTRAP
jgi:hypothetical protein